MPADTAAAPDVAPLVAELAAELRRRHVAVPITAVLDCVEALTHVDLERRRDVYWAARLTLVTRPDQRRPFDRAFALVLDGEQRDTGLGDELDADSTGVPDPDAARRQDLDEVPNDDTAPARVDGERRSSTDGGSADADAATDDEAVGLRFSVAEQLRRRDFATYTQAELVEARRLMAELRLGGSRRRSPRLTASRRPTARLDLQRTLRAAVRSQGEPVRRHYRRPATTNRRLILLLDVSGSMESYSRALLQFVHAAVAGRRRVEAFAIGTRLTRITRELSVHDPDRALAAAARRVTDWSGGTRLGVGLAEFNRRWGLRGVARGADVVVLSDGWDRGEPALIGAEMERLQRAAHRLVWVNPLKTSAGYAPLARGMAAALPHVDHFVSGNTLADLAALRELLDD